MTAPERFADSQIPLDRGAVHTCTAPNASLIVRFLLHAGRRPYMTAPERFADSQIPLAPRGSSPLHDRTERFAIVRFLLHRGAVHT